MIRATVPPPAKPQNPEETMSAYRRALTVAAIILLASPLATRGQGVNPPRKTAIFLVNKSQKSFDDKLATLEDFITGPLTEKGYAVISREIATDAASNLLKQKPETALDAAFSTGSAPLRLAQMLQADYLMLISISSFGTASKTSKINGSEVGQTTYTLRATYRLNEGILGASVDSKYVTVTNVTMSATGAETLDTDVINRLLEKAAEELGKKIPPPPPPATGDKPVEFTVVCGIAEAGGQSLSLPDIHLGEDRTVVIEKTPAPVLAVNATVELDGAAIGSTPDAFRALPGLHKIKITHEQCEPWERTLNVSPALRQKMVLQMTEKAYNRWKDQTAFLQMLKNGQLLTEAEAEKIKGIGQYFRNQSVKVDIKEDIKVDTKEGMKVYKSIY